MDGAGMGYVRQLHHGPLLDQLEFVTKAPVRAARGTSPSSATSWPRHCSIPTTTAPAIGTKFETHAFAGSISGNIGSYHHNLLADCTDRNWSLAGGLNQSGKYAGYLDIRNNVVYNWTARTTDGGVARMNYVNNYYKPASAPIAFVKWLLKLDRDQPGLGHGKILHDRQHPRRLRGRDE